MADIQELPAWMRSRDPRPEVMGKSRSKSLVIILSVLSATLAALSVYEAVEQSAWLHLAVIAAGAALLTLAVVSRIRCSWTARRSSSPWPSPRVLHCTAT